MTKQKLKKLLIKNHNRIKEAQKLVYSDDLINIVKKQLEKKGLEFSRNEFDFEFMLDELEYHDSIEEILLENKITNLETIKQIGLEFDDERISSSMEHAQDLVYSDFGESVEGFHDVLKKTRWNHNSKAYETDLLFEFDYAGLYGLVKLADVNLNEEAQYFVATKDINYYADNEIKRYFRGGATLHEAVKNQFEILKDFYCDLNYKKRDIKNKCLKLWEAVQIHNEDAKTAHRDQLEQDILSFIEDNSLIIQGDIEKIKFDYIAKIEGNKVITNKGAEVSLEDAKNILTEFLNGVDVIGKKIGSFTILKMFDIKNIIFLRIGCHLIKIDNELKQQLI